MTGKRGGEMNNDEFVKGRCLEASQLITNHYYLEHKGDAQREWMKLSSVTCQVTCR